MTDQINSAVPTFTVAEALQALNRAVPGLLVLPTRATLIQLGKDCAAVCRARNISADKREVFGKDWQYENAYPAEVVQEVFSRNPATREAYSRLHELRESRNA